MNKKKFKVKIDLKAEIDRENFSKYSSLYAV